MDKTSYKISMWLETVCLTMLVSMLPLTSYMGKTAFTVAIWSIYFTFPGTYSTQPAVTTQVKKSFLINTKKNNVVDICLQRIRFIPATLPLRMYLCLQKIIVFLF